MLHIMYHQRNLSQNHNEVSPHTCWNSYHHKDKKECQWGCKKKKKKESLHIVDWNVNNTKHKNRNESIKNLEGNI